MTNYEYIPGQTHYVPEPVSVDAEIAALKSTLLNKIKRSAYVYRVDCGGCNGCEIEIFASLTSIFDVERFGIKVVPSPRHADILLFTGSMTRAMRIPALRAFHAAPDPKICVSYGACGCGGGIFHDLYCVWGGSDKIVPIDVYIPGCPPTPQATIYGFAMALGLLEQKLHGQDYEMIEGEPAKPLFPRMPTEVRATLERKARALAGYQQGIEISDKIIQIFEESSLDGLEEKLLEWLHKENDPRLADIVFELKGVLCTSLHVGEKSV